MRDWSVQQRHLVRYLASAGLMLAGGLLLGCGEPVVAGVDGSGGADATGARPGSGGSLDTGAMSGSGSSSAGGAGAGAGASVCDVVDTAPTVLRRLSALEYRLSLQDLLALPEPPDASDVPLDNERLGFRTFAEYQTMSAENLRGYMDKAADLALDLLADPVRRASVVGCSSEEPSCLEEFVERFGKLAYRRPLEADEVAAVVAAATEFGDDVDDQYAFAIEAFLSSPQFLFRVEVGDTPEGLSQLSGMELASKLSFALWGRGPTAAQLDAGAAGALDTAEGLRIVAEEMLTDARTEAFFQQFFRQWLGYQELKPPDASAVAAFNDMQDETDRVVQEFAWGGGNFLDALTTNHTYVSQVLADFYGLPAPGNDGRVEFSADDPRANSGLLTHASLLSAKSDGDLIAIRGNWVMRTFLCEEIHIPAALADTIGELLVGLDRIGIVEARNTRAECKGCHALIDPVGIGFAAFDRSGIFDAGEDPSVFGIDAALPVAEAPNEFSTVSGLSAQLQAMPEVSQCLVKRAYLYTNGREPTATDSCTVDQVSQAFSRGGQTFRGLLGSLALDPSFRLRRAPDPQL